MRIWVRTGKNSGVSMSPREAGEALAAFFGLALVVLAVLAVWGLAGAAFSSVKAPLYDYVFNYSAHNQPHRTTGFLYYMAIKGLLFLVTTPYTLASMTAGSTLTPWPNLNLVAGIVLGVVLYRLLFALVMSAKSVMAHPAALVAILTPLAISAAYVLGNSLLSWLFARS